MISRASWDSPVLAAAEVHLWRADAGPETTERGSPQWLSDAEQRRAEAFRFDRDRGWYVARTVFLRGVLGAYSKRAAGEVTFSHGPSKKPYLAGDELRFNLSHSAGKILLAVTRGREVGVDIESTARAQDVERMAQRVFSSAEREELATATDEAKRALFFRGWTRKEAALKAIGTGFHRDPSSLHLGLEERESMRTWVPPSDFAEFGALMDVTAPEGFAAAVAAAGTDWTLVDLDDVRDG